MTQTGDRHHAPVRNVEHLKTYKCCSFNFFNYLTLGEINSNIK